MCKQMKRCLKSVSLYVVICMLLSLTACGSSQKSADTGTAVQEEEAVKEEAQADAGQEDAVTSEASEAEQAAEETAAAAQTTAAQTTAEADSTQAETAAADGTYAETAAEDPAPDYAKEENWAYFAIGEEKDADLFLICPTVDTKDEFNMAMDDEEVKKSFFGALNMERGIYEDRTRMFAPYYRQCSLSIYNLAKEEQEQYLEKAYSDVSAAFAWYLENENDGRPIVLAGFSQGADMCYRVLKEYFGDSELQKQLVAVYAIGWPMTEEMTAEYPQIKPAAGENDTGVVISFDCESEDLTESFINPAGLKSISINPLNWKTDSTPADKSLNTGACFTNYKAEIKQEIPQLCGCYIDDERGVLKVTDVTVQDYPPILPILPEGSYHIFDYQFFFRNLQQNVDLRISTYLENNP